MLIRNAAPDDSDALIALNAAVQQLHAHRFFAAQGFEPYLISFRAKVG